MRLRPDFLRPVQSRLDWEGVQHNVRLAAAALLKNYEWIVADPELLGGKLAIRGTRILRWVSSWECMANGMSLQDIDEAFL